MSAFNTHESEQLIALVWTRHNACSVQASACSSASAPQLWILLIQSYIFLQRDSQFVSVFYELHEKRSRARITKFFLYPKAGFEHTAAGGNRSCNSPLFRNNQFLLQLKPNIVKIKYFSIKLVIFMSFFFNCTIPNNILLLYTFSNIFSLFLDQYAIKHIRSLCYLFTFLWRLGAFGRDNNFQLAVLKINGQSIEKLAIDVNNPFFCCFCYFHLLPQEGWLGNKPMIIPSPQNKRGNEMSAKNQSVTQSCSAAFFVT